MLQCLHNFFRADNQNLPISIPANNLGQGGIGFYKLYFLSYKGCSHWWKFVGRRSHYTKRFYDGLLSLKLPFFRLSTLWLCLPGSPSHPLLGKPAAEGEIWGFLTKFWGFSKAFDDYYLTARGFVTTYVCSML